MLETPYLSKRILKNISESLPEPFYWLALQHIQGVGAVRYRQLIQRFETPEKLFHASMAELADTGLKSNAISAIKSIRNGGSTSTVGKQVMAELQWLEANNSQIIHCQDQRYPVLLAQIHDAPPLLYVQGNTALLNKPQLAIVGSRAASASGRQLAKQFAFELAQLGITVTSGLALGIDAMGHQGALQAGGNTVAVLGTGIDQVYPAKHRDLAKQIALNGALISEFTLGTTPRKDHFPRRNRVISGLCLGVLVVEAAVKSGSLITARMALEQGREVFTIPGSIHNPHSRGCHQLLRNGAKLVETVDDIIEEIESLAKAQMDLQGLPGGAVASVPFEPTGQEPELQNPELSKPKPQPNSDLDEGNAKAQKTLAAIGYEPTTVDTIVERSALPVAEILTVIIDLELEGHIECTDGTYQRNSKH